MSLLEYEQTHNSLLLRLTSNTDESKELRQWIIKNEASVVVPQTVTLETIDVSRELLEAHLIVPSRQTDHPNRFVTKNGALGTFDERRERVCMIASPQADASHSPSLGVEHASTGELVDTSVDADSNTPSTVADSSLQNLFESHREVFEKFEASRDANAQEDKDHPILVLRETLIEMEVDGRGTVVPIVLTSYPIYYDGCSWNVSDADMSWKEAVKQQRTSTVEEPSTRKTALMNTSAKLAGAFSRLTGGAATNTSNDAMTSPRRSKEENEGGGGGGGGGDDGAEAPRSRGKLETLASMVRSKRGNSARTDDDVLSTSPSVTTMTDDDVVVQIGVALPQQAEAAVPNFMSKVKQAKAAEIYKRLKMFVKEFTDRANAGKMLPHKRRVYVRNFVNDTMQRVHANPLWRDASDAEMEAALESVEKFIMTRIYSLCFTPDAPEQRERDEAVRARIDSLAWLQPRYLDIAESVLVESRVEHAKAEMCKMNEFKTPRDKLVCILNSCKVVYSLLQGSEAGADDFLPLLIFVVIQANPPQLASNLGYIGDYRAQSRLMSESGYYFTQLQSVLSFLDIVDHTRLSCTKEEWDAHMSAPAAVEPTADASTVSATTTESDASKVLKAQMEEQLNLLSPSSVSKNSGTETGSSGGDGATLSSAGASLIDLDVGDTLTQSKSTQDTSMMSASGAVYAQLSAVSQEEVVNVFNNERAQAELGDAIRFLGVSDASHLADSDDINALLSAFKTVCVARYIASDRGGGATDSSSMSAADALFAALSPRASKREEPQ